LGTYALANCHLVDPGARPTAPKDTNQGTFKEELTSQVNSGARSSGVSPDEWELECAVWHYRRDRASLDDLTREAEFRLSEEPGDSGANRVR
jgi:hypothetical protein